MLAGDASGVGDERFLLRYLAPTPARSWRGSCARKREEREAGECGANGDVIAGQRREKERAAQSVRGRHLPRALPSSEKNKGSCSFAAAAPPSWWCTRDGGEPRRGSGGVGRARVRRALFKAYLRRVVDAVQGGG